MNPDLARAIRAPLTLIVLGALFAVDHMTPYGFRQTWPVLLIVFGILTLFSRESRPPYVPPPPGPPPASTGIAR